MVFRLFASQFLVLTLIFTASEAACYRPDGSLEEGTWLPCNKDASQDSMCCALGIGVAPENRTEDTLDQCLPEGLCFNPSAGTYWRGSCTDKTWKSPNCNRLCIDGEVSAKSASFIRTNADSRYVGLGVGYACDEMSI